MDPKIWLILRGLVVAVLLLWLLLLVHVAAVYWWDGDTLRFVLVVSMIVASAAMGIASARMCTRGYQVALLIKTIKRGESLLPAHPYDVVPEDTDEGETG